MIDLFTIFTDTDKMPEKPNSFRFSFAEMAERHNAGAVLSLSRSLVLQVQTLIENK